MHPNLISIAYLASSGLFILGLRSLTHPRSAYRGNQLAMLGMALAFVITLSNQSIGNYGMILSGIALGAVIGTLIGRRVPMTAMPQLVALLHSFVGLCAVLVAFGIYAINTDNLTGNKLFLLELAIGVAVGAVTFTGSLIAFGKLQGLLSGKPQLFPGRHLLNMGLLIAVLIAGAHFLSTGEFSSLLTMAALAFVLGILLIIPIGGVDMPVIVSMLNSYSGWAAAATGFTLGNPVLIITGALVGFSGAILSFIMCRAMNRSFFSVLLGGLGNADDPAAQGQTDRQFRRSSVEDAVFLLENADRIIVVPGYGMAVAQAQHGLNELRAALAEREIDFKFAIHPVAGRMPGHMNVLLAEADVPYEQVIEMDEINPEFSNCDVALVIGANDVTNPAAKSDQSSPIYGMPILDVYKARQVLFVKRSMKPGYSGIDNELFYTDNCSLLFGDAKEVCESLVSELRAG